MQRFEARRLPSDAAHQAARWIRQTAMYAGSPMPWPKVGIILGSGLNDLLPMVEVAQTIAYQDIPHFPPTTVAGHSGQLDIGTLHDVPVALLRGRFHLYEGHSPELLALPVRTLHALGVETLIVTNAAGGLNPAFHQGDLMVMRDHIGLPTLGGQNPLIGPNDEAVGPRFVPMGAAYDAEMIEWLRNIAKQAHVKLHEGVYIMVAGPTYETPAELRALRFLGADAVGMSTVPEVIAARHLGMKVLGISCITNAATPEEATSVNHDEVLQGARATLPHLDRLLSDFFRALSQKEIAQDSLVDHGRWWDEHQE